MKTFQKTALHIEMMILINTMYFFWQPYDKHILRLPFSSVNPMDLCTGIIYFFLFFAVWIWVIATSFSWSKKLEVKRCWKPCLALIGVLFGVRIVFDVLKTICTYRLSFYSMIANGLIDVVFLLVTVVSIYQITVFKNRSLIIVQKQNHTVFLTCIFIGLVFLGIFIWLHLESIALFAGYMRVGQALSEIQIQRAQNLDFQHQIRVLLLEIGISSLICIALNFKRDASNRPKERWGRYFSRLTGLLFIAFILIGIKSLILPYNAIGTVNFSGSASIHGDFKDSFDLDYTTIEIPRKTGYLEERIIYKRTRYDIWYGNAKLLTFEEAGGLPELTLKNNLQQGNTIILYDPLTDLEIDGITASRLANAAIMYLDSGNQPIAIKTDRLDGQSPDAVLTKILETQLTRGDLSLFESSSGYLAANDLQFIIPYLERFAAGNFTDGEIKGNPAVSMDAVTEKSQQLLLKALG